MSIKISKLWSFITKYFTRLLPLADTYKSRYLALYKDVNCLSCNYPSVIEDWNHMFECLKLQDNWKYIEFNCIAAMIKVITKSLKNPDTSNDNNQRAAEMAEQIV